MTKRKEDTRLKKVRDWLENRKIIAGAVVFIGAYMALSQFFHRVRDDYILLSRETSTNIVDDQGDNENLNLKDDLAYPVQQQKASFKMDERGKFLINEIEKVSGMKHKQASKEKIVEIDLNSEFEKVPLSQNQYRIKKGNIVIKVNGNECAVITEHFGVVDLSMYSGNKDVLAYEVNELIIIRIGFVA